MASHPEATKYDDARRRLDLVAKAIFNSAEHINPAVSNSFTTHRKYLAAIKMLGNAADRLAMNAARLSLDHARIIRMAPKRPTTIPKLNPAAEQREFHFFSRLPGELRLLIWEAAAQPPPCAHYFATHKVFRGGRHPAAYLMEDGGLWTACQESRWAVEHMYRTCRKNVRKKGCSAPSKKHEMHYRRLARLNKSGEQFMERICQFNNRYLDRFVNHKIDVLSLSMPEFYDIEPDYAFRGKHGEPTAPTKIRKQLTWSALFD